MAHYQSELTDFLRSLKADNPDLEAQQKQARAYWWDKHPDPDDQQRWAQARQPRGSYVYYSAGRKDPAGH